MRHAVLQNEKHRSNNCFNACGVYSHNLVRVNSGFWAVLYWVLAMGYVQVPRDPGSCLSILQFIWRKCPGLKTETSAQALICRVGAGRDRFFFPSCRQGLVGKPGNTEQNLFFHQVLSGQNQFYFCSGYTSSDLLEVDFFIYLIIYLFLFLSCRYLTQTFIYCNIKANLDGNLYSSKLSTQVYLSS